MKNLPHSLAAEKSVCGSVLVDPDCLPVIPLHADQFFDLRTRSVFECFVELRSTGTAIDLATVEASLQRSNRLAAVGGLPFLSELALDTPTAANVLHYAAIVADLDLTRQVMLAASDLVQAGRDGALSGDEMLSRLSALSRRLTPSRLRGTCTARELAERRTRELVDHSEASARGEQPARIPTGLRALDDAIGGLPRGNHTGLVAPTGHGKTATLMHIAFNAPVPVLVFTFEELARDAVDRFLSARTGIPAIDITALRINAQQMSAIIGAVDGLPQHIHFVDARGMTDEQVVRLARRVVPQKNIGLVAVDYLNRVRLSAPAKLRTDERMRHALALFDDCCGELDVAWITAAQVNRTPGKEDRAPRITDARECAALEEYSKVGLVVYRPNKDRTVAGTDGQQHALPDDVIEILIDKANIGGRTACEFSWHGPTMTIDSAQRELL